MQLKTMAFLAIIIAITIFDTALPQRIMHDEYYCYSQDPIRPQNGMHASESAYEALRRPAIDPNVSTCTPSKFWFLGRHGGRVPSNPTLSNILDLAEGPFNSQLINNYMLGRSLLCAEDFELMRDFYPNFTRADGDRPTVAAYNTMVRIGQHYQSVFPILLPHLYNRSAYLFRDGGRERTRRSLEGFVDGLFGLDEHENVEFEDIPEYDTLLRSYALCPAFNELQSYVEADAFLSGPEFRATVSQVNEKLGFRGSEQLTVQDIITLWRTCAFVKASNLTIPSPMCAAFSVANNEVLEFRDDLEMYYTTGYGLPNRRLVENLACGLMNNLLRFLQSSDSSDETARIYVSTYSTMMVVAVSLGIFEDDVPLSRHSISRTRVWNTSWISPNGAHLAVVRYDCANGENEVAFLYNERPLHIPGCNANGLCKVNDFIRRYNRFLNANCDELHCTDN